MASRPLAKKIQYQAYHLVFWQFVGVGILALITLLISGQKSGLSVLMGGLAYSFANFIFVWRVFRYAGAQQMTLFAVAFFTGEMFKLIVSAILVLIIVKYLSVSLLSVLIGFIGAIISFWIACVWQFSKKNVI